MENEIWVDVLNYEGLYQVSNLGRVKSLAKKWLTGNGGLRIKNDTILKNGLCKTGYYTVSLCKKGTQKTYKVHRLVWESFNGKTDLQVDHIAEGNKLDNRLCNLQAITNRENTSKHRLTINKSSIFTGVSFDKKSNKFKSQITINSKVKHLGYFFTEIEAYKAYQNAL